MKRFFTLLALVATMSVGLNAQQALDFTFTDTHGDTHNLQHALDQGYIVLIDFFFVDCPPCQASAPELAAIVNDYTDAGKNVIMWSISDRDANDYIMGFEQMFGLTNPAGGTEGGGPDVINLYANNFNFTGFPTISVVCPDGSITWDIWPYSAGAPEWRGAIDACGAVDADPYVPFSATNVEEVAALGSSFLAPNPAADISNLKFELTEAVNLDVAVYNAQGQVVKAVFNGRLNAGQHNFEITVDELPQGAYFVRLQNEIGEVTTLPLQKL